MATVNFSALGGLSALCVSASARPAPGAAARACLSILPGRKSLSLRSSKTHVVQAARVACQADVILEPLPSYKGQILPGMKDIQFQLEHNFNAPVVVGAVPGMSDVVLDIPTVSGKHAQFDLVDGTLVCKDLKSTNGTRVNGKKVPRGGEVELRQGDVVSFSKDCPFKINYDMQSLQ